MAFVKVAEARNSPPGSARVVEAGGRELALFNVGGEFYCIDNTCPHNEGPLGEGGLEADVVMCPWHAWQFNVRTGRMIYNESMCVATYPCKLTDGDVLVDV